MLSFSWTFAIFIAHSSDINFTGSVQVTPCLLGCRPTSSWTRTNNTFDLYSPAKSGKGGVVISSQSTNTRWEGRRSKDSAATLHTQITDKMIIELSLKAPLILIIDKKLNLNKLIWCFKGYQL